MTNRSDDQLDPDVNEGLLGYLNVCKQMFERMSRDNSWPWEVDSERWKQLQDERRVAEKKLARRRRAKEAGPDES